MKSQEQKEALQNAMHFFKFPEKYFLHQVNKGSNTKFIFATSNEHGGINTHSIAMSYDECNFYLRGWYDAKMNKL